MDALMAFVSVRLSEDECVATAVGSRGPTGTGLFVVDDDYRHDTVAVPAERIRSAVAARRRTLSHHKPTPSAKHPFFDCLWCGYLWPCFDARAVASEWCHHPDYDQQWDL